MYIFLYLFVKKIYEIEKRDTVYGLSKLRTKKRENLKSKTNYFMFVYKSNQEAHVM